MKSPHLRLGLSLAIALSFYILFLSLITTKLGVGASFAKAASQWYLGYDITFRGIIIGMTWAFIDGFIGGIILVSLYQGVYNLLQKILRYEKQK